MGGRRLPVRLKPDAARVSVLFLAAALVGWTPARAQDSVSEILSFLVTNHSVITDDFVRDQEAAAATRDTMSRFLQVELATLPIGSSSSGFIYRLNPSLGTMERVSDSFGPFFLERALTSGRGQTSIGFTYRSSELDTLDGRALTDGRFVTTANRLVTEPEPFDVETLTLRLDARTFTVFGNYGVTDRLDIGAALPIVDLSLSGARVNLYRGALFEQASGAATVTGLADVAVRAKYSVVQNRTFGFAAQADLRLPTGDEEQLLGSGAAALHVSGIASLEGPRIGSHLTGGVGFGGVSDELEVGAAIVFAATPRFNIVGEIFGRRLEELARIAEVSAPHPQIPNVATTRLLPVSTGATSAFAVAGMKWNLARTWLLNANVLFPLTETGLTGRPTPTIAIDYTFGRE